MVEDTPTEATVPEDTGDVTQTEENVDQTAATGMTTSPRPRTRPDPVVAAVAEPDPEPQPEAPTEVAADTPPVEDPLEALLDEAAADAPPPEDVVESGGQDLPLGPPLTGSEMGNISSVIGRRWNLGASSTDALSTMIVVRVTFDQTGKPINFELLESNGPSQTAIDHIYRLARSAVTRASIEDGGLPLPPDKYEIWRVLDLVFDANGMRAR